MVVRFRNLVLAAGAVLYGYAAMANGADRLSAFTPGIERLVPAPFRGSANAAHAVLALSRKDFPAAEEAAGASIAASPLNRDAVGLLALSRLLQNKADPADAAFRVSGQLGWRDTPTQLYWYAVGIDNGDYTLAAQRIDALLRANPDYPEAPRLIRPLESTPAGRAALVARLRERPEWLGRFARPGDNFTDEQLADRSAVLALLAQQHVVLGCDGVSALATRLVDRGMRSEGVALWKSQCGREQTSGAGLFDPGFGALAARVPSPFAWRTFTSGDVDVQTGIAPDGKPATTLSNSSAFSVIVLQQSVQLAPGAWRAQLQVTDPATARGKIFATIGCGANPGRTETTGDIVGAGQTIAATPCDKQFFSIWLRPRVDGVTLRRVTLTPQTP